MKRAEKVLSSKMLHIPIKEEPGQHSMRNKYKASSEL